MSVSWKRGALIGGVLLVALGGALWWGGAGTWWAAVTAAAGLLAGATALRHGGGRPPGLEESDEIRDSSEARRRELIRGTSLFLRDQRYRYSVRLDTHPTRDRAPFGADVNSMRLGFLPAVITDNTTDRQGRGFVAFVHDGRRWRGPGLPCPGDQAEAVRHATRCIAPLDGDAD